MRKYVLFLVIILSITGCTNIKRFKGRTHKAPFIEQIKEGEYKLSLYEIEYPLEYQGKKEFYNDFDSFLKKRLLYDYNIDLVYPQELQSDIDSLKNNSLLVDEKLYDKVSSDLSNEDKKKIDEKIGIDIIRNRGDVQYYLDKQVYFWMDLLKRNSDFDKSLNYTELDKEMLVLEVKNSRKELLNLLKEVNLNALIKVKDFYKESDKTINEEFLNTTDHLYIKDINDEDIEKILNKEIKFKSKVVVIENNVYKGYTLIDGNYRFFVGGNKKINYYDNYDISLEKNKKELKDLVGINSDFIIENLLNPKSYKKRQEK